MAFQYTFRADDFQSFKDDDVDLLENRDRELETYLNQPSVKLRRVAAQSFVRDVGVLINFDTEDSDEYGFYSGSGGTLTMPSTSTGLYVMGVQLNWSASPITSKISLRANSYVIASVDYLFQTKILLGGTAYLDSGDTIDLRAEYHADAGVTLSATATLWMARVLA